MMRVGFNLLPYVAGRHGGAEVFLRTILQTLTSMPRGFEILLFGQLETTREYLADGCGDRSVDVPGPWARSRASRLLAEQILLPPLYRKHRLDVMVSNYVTPIMASRRQVVIVHDMLYRRYPSLFERSKLLYWQIMVPASIRRSASVVTVSQFSAQEILTFFPHVQHNLFVATEAVRPSLVGARQARDTEQRLPARFLLCVATFGRHKNLHTLIRALASLPERHADLSLILVGAARTPDAMQYRMEVHGLASELGLASRILFTDHVSDNALAALYGQALALVFPSLYEGFGLPVVEAQYFGCPVLCSDRGALPEVAGAAAITFDATSVDATARALLSFLDQPDSADELRRAGYVNLARFSWDLAAAKLAEAIDHASQ